MLLLDGKSGWMFVVETAILFYGIFLKNSICESSGTIETCQQKNILFISNRRPDSSFKFPSRDVYCEANGYKLCFSVLGNNTDCCNTGDFNCSFEIRDNHSNSDSYSVILNKETLSKQDIVVMSVPDDSFNCMPSKFYKNCKNSGFLLNIHNCLNKGKKNFRLSQNCIYGDRPLHDEKDCKAERKYKFTIYKNESKHCECLCESFKPPGNISITVPTSESNKGSRLENAVNIMNNLSSHLEKLGNSIIADITIGNNKGMITKLSRTDQTDINVGITTSRDIIIRENTDLLAGASRLVHVPKEASNLAIERNGSFVGVVFFIVMSQDDPSSSFLDNEVVGIDMGTEISNLSHTIDIHYRNVDKNGNIASCRSWDGKGKEPIWITDGCQTNETGDTITCQCSHLTFFAILLSPPPQNISSSDFTALSYITSIGCGLSIFFLIVALFMHCVIRKGKASQATKILINLFVAMFTLNLSFLINESVADLGNFSACVAMAAVMHYTMLATFTWFFIEALHLSFNLWKIPTESKHYMTKICVLGWVTPAVVVIALLASGKYDYVVINANDGNSAKMCWISDAVVHQGVNVGFYAIVFIFTFTILIITVQQIVMLKPTAGKAQDISSIRTNSFSVLGLLLLLGITWAFAFFSHGPLLIASYYIFTILNSFQGFFLFIYYYYSSKSVGVDRSATVSSSSITSTSNTVVTSV